MLTFKVPLKQTPAALQPCLLPQSSQGRAQRAGGEPSSPTDAQVQAAQPLADGAESETSANVPRSRAVHLRPTAGTESKLLVHRALHSPAVPVGGVTLVYSGLLFFFIPYS